MAYRTVEDPSASHLDEVRRAFHQLKHAAQDVHGGSEMTAGLRGVLFDLLVRGAQTVPVMARARPVSRQHIQTLVNHLRENGLVELEENLAHRRSKLVSLTPAGRAEAKRMRTREAEVLRTLPSIPSPDRLREAAQILREARELFRGDDWEKAIAG